MNKTSILIIIIISICIIIVSLFIIININKKTSPLLFPNKNKAQTSGCMYVYKTNQDYFKYVAVRANNRTGEYKIMTRTTSFGDEKLTQNYILGRGGCISNNQSLASDLVILNLTKSDVYNDLGYPGCTNLKKQKYPQCYGDIQYKQGQNPECDAIYEKEKSSNTSICSSHSFNVSNILAKNVITEFYVCKYSTGKTVEEYNYIINNGQLDTVCTKII